MINEILKKVRKRIAFRNSQAFINYLEKCGCQIGTQCVFYEPKSVFIDLTRPYLIEIGNNVKITRGVTLLTHGFDWVVLREYYGTPLGSCGKIKIGNNVFIGMHSTILKNVTIGSNVIIGTGSVITKDIPDGVLVAGNPAKIVRSLKEHYEIVKSRQLFEAKNQAIMIKKTGRIPVEEDFYKSYFSLFWNRDESNPTVDFQIGAHSDRFRQTKPTFNSFPEFLEYCFRPEKGTVLKND